MTAEKEVDSYNTDKREKRKPNPYILPIGMAVLSAICIPYIYYAVQINMYM